MRGIGLVLTPDLTGRHRRLSEELILVKNPFGYGLGVLRESLRVVTPALGQLRREVIGRRDRRRRIKRIEVDRRSVELELRSDLLEVKTCHPSELLEQREWVLDRNPVAPVLCLS